MIQGNNAFIPIIIKPTRCRVHDQMEAVFCSRDLPLGSRHGTSIGAFSVQQILVVLGTFRKGNGRVHRSRYPRP